MASRRTGVDGAAVRPDRVAPFRPRVAARALAFLLASLAVGAASAIELRDAGITPGGSPVLQNEAGTVQLEDARLGRVATPVAVPEPSALCQLGSGVALLALLGGWRRRRSPARSAQDPDAIAPGRGDRAASRRTRP